MPTRVYQEHDLFESTIKLSNSYITAPDGGIITTEYERVASTKIKNDYDPDGVKQSAQIEGGMSAIYRNNTIWTKCSGSGVFGPCTTTSAIWFTGPYRHHIAMLFDPKIHNETNINFDPEGLHHLDENHFSHVNNRYYKNEGHYKYFPHFKPNIPDHYSLTILLYNTDYSNSVHFIDRQNPAKLKIVSRSTTIQTNYIVDSNIMEQLIPFEISDDARNTSIILTNHSNARSKLNGKRLDTGDYELSFKACGKIIIPNNKDFLTILITQPNRWYIDELALEASYIGIANAEGQSNDALGKIVLNNTNVFDVQLINNIQIIDTDANMNFSITRCIDNRYPVTYSKRSNSQFQITSDNNTEPLDLDKILYSLHKINETLLTIKFSDQCDYTIISKNNKIFSIKGKIAAKDSILTIGGGQSILETVAKGHQQDRHIKVINYSNAIELKDNFKFNQVLEQANYNSSAYYRYLNKHNFTNWNIIKFESGGRTALYHFQHNNIRVNDIEYLIIENKIYAVPTDNMDGSKLLTNNKGKPIAILVNTTLSNSEMSLEEDSLEINNSTLYNLPDSTIFVFQKSNGGTLPISLRLLKDSFKYTNDNSDKEYSILSTSPHNLDKRLETIVQQNSQDNTQNKDTKTSSLFSSIRFPSFKILPGAEATIIEDGHLVDLPAAVKESATSRVRRPTSWIRDLWQFGKKQIGNLIDSYYKPASLDSTIEHLNDLKESFNDPLAIDGPSVTPGADPTILNMGDQLVQNSDINGLFTWGILLAQKWTGYCPKAVKIASHDAGAAIERDIQSRDIVNTFIDAVANHAQACGINKKALSDVMENPTLYTQSIQIVSKQLAKGKIEKIEVADTMLYVQEMVTSPKPLAKGKIESIIQLLFKKIIQNNISKIVSKSTPDQAIQFLSEVTEDLPNIEQQCLQQATETAQEANIKLLKQAICSMPCIPAR